MRYQKTTRFDGDLNRLSAEEQALFRKVVLEEFVPAVERWVENPGSRWPASLQVKPLKNASGIWTMTWSFTGPVGRATFEWVKADAPMLRWRRIGGLEIFGEP